MCDPRASKHDQAVGQLVGFVADALCTCDAALTEACFHLPRAFQRQRLRALLDRLDIGPPPVAYGREFWREALDWLTKYGQHDPD